MMKMMRVLCDVHVYSTHDAVCVYLTCDVSCVFVCVCVCVCVCLTTTYRLG